MSTICVRLEEHHLTDGEPNSCYGCGWALAVCDALGVLLPPKRALPHRPQKRIEVSRSRTVDWTTEEVAEHPQWVRELITLYDDDQDCRRFIGMEAELEFRPLAEPPALEVIQGAKP